MSLLDKISRVFSNNSQDTLNYKEDLLSSLLVMAWMVEARDPYTGGHLWRVSRMSNLLATEMKLSPADVSRITIGGFLHDLGKVSVPDSILNKKGPLTDDEYDIIKTHPDVGWRMIAGHPLASLIEASVRGHHEKPDGKGYPRGLSGHDIPVDARIVGICDAFDAMTSTRSYRRGMPIEKALSIIESNLGTQFDQNIGETFIKLGQSSHELLHIVGHSDEGIPLHECPMCGPTLVVQKDQGVGDHTYCRSCSGEFKLEEKEGSLVTQMTGKLGRPKNLEPEVDRDLIAKIVRDSAQHLSF